MVTISSSASATSSVSYLNKNQRTQESYINKAASGKSITKASDNAAGLAVATILGSDVSTLKQASTNLVQGTSLLQTADGALEQTGNILTRMKDLATQASSGSLDSTARSNINQEYQSLVGELNGVASNTSFNGTKLVDGSYNQTFQAGSSTSDSINVNLSGVDASATGLGLTAANGANANALSTPAAAAATSAELDTAISNLSSYRAQTGALQSEFQTKSDVVDTTSENLQAAQSAITDADIGQVSTGLSSSKLLSEASMAAAAQSNRMQASLLKLVR